MRQWNDRNSNDFALMTVPKQTSGHASHTQTSEATSAQMHAGKHASSDASFKTPVTASEMVLLGALASAAGPVKPLKLDAAVGQAKGEVKVTVKLSAAEAGALKAKIAEGSLPAGVTVQAAVEQGTVTLSGRAAEVKQVLADIYFAPNPSFQKDFSIQIEAAHEQFTSLRELKMHFDEGSGQYQSFFADHHAGISVSDSIHEGVVLSETVQQDVSQVQIAPLVGVMEVSHSSVAPSSFLHIAQENTFIASTEFPVNLGILPGTPAPAPSVSILPSAPLPLTPVEKGPVTLLGIPSPVAVSNPPVLTGVDSPVAYNENAAALVLDNDVTLVDGDSANLSGGKITVGYAGVANAGDALSLNNDALAAGAIRLNGTAVEHSATGAIWTQVGTLTTNGSLGTNLVITLNGAATPLIVERILEHVTYTSTDDNPPASKGITFVVEDGQGGISSTQNLTINITAVNDTPVVSNAIADQTAAVSSAFSFQVPGNSFIDPDNASLTYSATKSDNTALPAWISFNPATQTFTGTPGAGDLGTLSVKVTVSDGTLNTNDVFDIVVTNGLAASNLTRTETYTEDTNFNLTDIVAATAAANITATLILSAPAAGSLTVGTSGAVTSTYNAGTGVWTASGAKADVNTLLASVTFNPAANYNGNFSIATQVTDGVSTLNGTLTLNGTAVNDAPAMAGNIDQFIVDTAGLNYALPAIGALFTDVEGHTVTLGTNLEYWNGATWTTTLPGGFAYNSGTTTLTVAPGTAIGGYTLRIAGTDNGPGTPTGYATFVVGISTMAYYGTAGADSLTGTAANETFIGLAGNDTLSGGNGNDTLFGNDGSDTIYGEAGGSGSLGNDIIYGGAHNDNLYGDSTNDAVGGKDTIYGGTGSDNLYGYANDDVLYGEENNDALYGGSGNDNLYGGANDDKLHGEAGADTLFGGAGNDIFIMFTPNTDSTNAITDVIEDFAQGEDKIQPTGYVSLNAAQANAAASTATMLTWEQSGGNTFVYGSGGTFTLKLTGLHNLIASDFVFATHTGTSGTDTIVGSSGIDLMYGYDGDDSLSGGSGGNDFIWGGNGNDTIYGGWGMKAATLTGDAGSDIFVFRHTRDGYSTQVSTITDFQHGIDKIYLMNIPVNGILATESQDKMGYNYNAGTNTTTITWNGGSTEQFSIKLTGNITLDDNDFVFHAINANVLGTSTVHGSHDADGIIGTAGDDYIFPYGYEWVGNESQFWGDQVFAGAGNDFVRISGTSYIQQARLGDGNDTVVGESMNWAWGGNGNNVFIVNNPVTPSNYAGGGNNADTMIGAGGADNFSGNSGNDLMIGWGGNDGYNGGGLNDTLNGGAGNDDLNGFNDADTIIGGMGQDTLTMGTNNDQAWYYYTTESTNAAADRITDFNSNGVDTIFLHPGTGATAYAQIDHSTTTTIGPSTYTIVKFTLASGLDANFQILLQGDLTATLTAANFIFGNAPYTLNPAGENYTGTSGSAAAGADYITGSGVADTISGNGGADVIYAGTGNDTIQGGPAVGDTYGDEVNGEGGNDTIQGGSWHDTMTGGDQDDSILGGDGYDSIDGGNDNDTLYGENDIDTLDGGAGNDSLYGGNGIDFLHGSGGVDKLFGEAGHDFLTYDAADLSNDGVIDLSGGADIDTLRSVVGSVMNATMLDGTDIVGIERFETMNTGTTVMVFAATYDDGAAADSIYGGTIEVDGTANLTAANTLNIDASALDTQIWLVGGWGADTFTGGTNNDLLGGGTGNDSLIGNNGNDTFGGGLGVDTITGGAGNDRFVYTYRTESTTTGRDRITDYTDGQDEFIFTGIDFYNKAFTDFTIAFGGGDTTISLNGTTFQLLLTGDHTATLDATDFIFN